MAQTLHTSRVVFGHVDEFEGSSVESERSFASVDCHVERQAPAEPSYAAPYPAVATREDKVAAMRELYALGDADGALLIARTISRPSVPPEPSEGGGVVDVTVPIHADVSIPVDISLPPDLAAAPPLSRVAVTLQTIARVVKSPSELSGLPIDHRGGFLLTCIDGAQTLDEILDVCAMPLREALEVIQSLAALGVIELTDRRLRR